MTGSPLSAKVLSVVTGEPRRTVFHRILEEAGFGVRCADSGRTALELASAKTPDIVLLDLHLPDMTGFEVSRHLKRCDATASVPVLHLVGSSVGDEEIASQLGQGDDVYLADPVDAAELLTRIRTLLQQRQQQRQFDSFLEAAPDAVIICDGAGQIVRANGQAEKMFGYSQKELVGQPVELLMPSRFRDSHCGHRERFSENPSTRPMGAVSDLWGLRKDGSEFPVEINLSPLPGGKETLITSIIRDVTNRKRLEQELREADRMKNNFLATLAHELRSPLSAARMAEQLIRLNATELPELEETLDVMDRQLVFMTRLVEDLSDVSSITKGKFQFRSERVDLSGPMKAAVEASRPQIETRKQQLTISFPSDTMFLDADPIRLTQVFTNLLNNAAKFTENGGQISFSAARDEEEAVVSVKDTGAGIPSEMLLKVFDCFTQVDQTRSVSRGGLGIGLSLVRGLVETHGGSVEARSEGPGRGSEFLVRLPLATSSPLHNEADSR